MSTLNSTALTQGWQWKQRESSNTSAQDELISVSSEWVGTTIPTEIFLDLLRADKIPDPHIDEHERSIQWVGEKDWLYRTSFSYHVTGNPDEIVSLVFEGLDTYAIVYVNGIEILKSDNMFHEHRVEITKLVKEGSNHLGIVFESALLKGREDLKKYGNLMCWNGEPSRLYVRKAQYHYGWDWGPVIMSAGPWKPIRLESYTNRLNDIHFNVTLSENLSKATVSYTFYLDRPCINSEVRIALHKPESEKANPRDETATIYSERVSVVPGNNIVKGNFEMDKPKLWYPNGYGPQTLYGISVELYQNGKLLHTREQNLGIRKAELIQRPLINSGGTTFFFRVNNIPIFCAGSNWIPADNILTRISPQRYRAWLKLLVKGGQNMIRVWGGGIYEHDVFYHACDELGILVWQDFAFGCGQYPAHPEFLENVEREAITQVKRLRSHPSIVIFAGNNEDYQLAESHGLEYDPKDLNPENWLTTNFPARYIYEKILPEVVRTESPAVYYHFGSPWGGKDTRDNTVGDIHQWNVWHGTQEPYQTFSKLGGRFVSEFGMQALPSPRTINYFITNPKERYPQSRVMDHHNKATGFERRLGAYVLENYRLSDFDLVTYYLESQRMQGDALGEAYRAWRREWRGQGKEYIGGVLVWQLNDTWPGTSWSIVDYFLRPKLSYYSIARELRPLNVALTRIVKFTNPIILPEEPSQKLNLSVEEREERNKDPHSTPHEYGPKTTIVEFWANNATMDSVEASWKLIIQDIKSGQFINDVQTSYSGTVRLLPNQTTELGKIDLTSHNPTTLVVAVQLYTAQHDTITSSLNFSEPLKYLSFPSRGISIVTSSDSVCVKAERPTKGVVLDVKDEDDDGIWWEDNGFDLFGGQEKVVKVEGLKGRDVVVRWYGDHD